MRFPLARAAATCGLAAGLAVGAIDSAFALLAVAGSVPPADLAIGVANTILLDASAGLLAAAITALVFGLAASWRRLTAVAAAIREAAGGGSPEKERRWLAAGIAAAACGAGAAAALFALALEALPRLRADAAAAVPLGIAAPLLAAAALVTGRWLGAVLRRGLERLPDRAFRILSARAVAAAALVALAAAAGPPLAELSRAIDLRPLALAAALLAGIAVGLVAAASSRSAAARLARLTSGRRLAVVAAILLAAWLVVPIAGAGGPAVAVYRGGAPLAGIGARLAATALDFDGDGASSLFGGGDCAPLDPRRHPGAIEVPGNDIDEDCFDGPLARRAPPPPVETTAPPAAVPEPLSIAVILIDALRSDHMSLYGYQRRTTPNLDRLAAGAAVFERAYSPSSYTYPSLAAIMTGKPASATDPALLEKRGSIAGEPTLAAALRGRGYATIRVTDYGSQLARAGLARDFEVTRRVSDEAAAAVDRAIAALDRAGQRPFLLWLELFSPHHPYRARGPDFGDAPMDAYDSEIAYADRELGRLLDALARRGDVAIAVIADHGEAFGEHGSHYHGHNLYDENVRVPLILAVPGIEPRRLGAEPVSLIDLAPTLLNLARAPVPAGMRGRDLTRAITTGDQGPGRTVFIESAFRGYGVTQGYRAAVVTRRHKLIESSAPLRVELFDLEADPGERRDVSAAHPALTRELRRELRRLRY